MANYKKATQEAERILKENYVTEYPVIVEDIALNYGFEVEEVDLPHNVAGLVDMEERIIFVNESDSPNRKVFTIAHELGHIILHEKDLKENPELSLMYRSPLGKEEEHSREKEANCFAANLLVPLDQLQAVQDKYQELANYKTLSELFGVSEDVIKYRILDLNIKRG